MNGLRLGTRGSPLALAQARKVASAIEVAQRWPDGWVQIVEISTTGDQILDRPLAEIGGKALWTKELDRALLAEELDFCVHSMKDVESVRPNEIHIAAVRPRGDVRDRIVGAESIDALKQGAVVGTSSPRRAAQLLAASPRPQDRAAARQCRNPAEEGRGRRGRCDPAGFGGPEAARHRRRLRDPDRDHPSRAGPGGDRHGMPDQRHPHAKRAEHGQQPDHLFLRDGRARLHPGARRELLVAGRGLLRARGRRFADARPAVQRGRPGHGRGARGVRLRRSRRPRSSSRTRCWPRRRNRSGACSPRNEAAAGPAPRAERERHGRAARDAVGSTPSPCRCSKSSRSRGRRRMPRASTRC